MLVIMMMMIFHFISVVFLTSIRKTVFKAILVFGVVSRSQQKSRNGTIKYHCSRGFLNILIGKQTPKYNYGWLG